MADITKEPNYIRKDGNERIVGQFSEFKGKQYFSIRAWYRETELAEWKPGKNGINLPTEEQDDFLKLVVKFFGQAAITKATEAVEQAAVVEA